MYDSVSSKMPFIISYIIQGYLGYTGSINTRKLMIICTYKWLKNVCLYYINKITRDLYLKQLSESVSIRKYPSLC